MNLFAASNSPESPITSGFGVRAPARGHSSPNADAERRPLTAPLAEVLPLKGWMLMRQGRGAEAEAQLRASIDWARQQQAKSWELRSSMTLTELLAERSQRDEARDLLASVYNWFSEGFATKDLKDAKALLVKLS